MCLAVEAQRRYLEHLRAAWDAAHPEATLTRQQLVLTVPGVGFGTPGYFRVSFCVDDHTLEGSLPGFEEAFKEAGG